VKDVDGRRRKTGAALARLRVAARDVTTKTKQTLALSCLARAAALAGRRALRWRVAWRLKRYPYCRFALRDCDGVSLARKTWLSALLLLYIFNAYCCCIQLSCKRFLHRIS